MRDRRGTDPLVTVLWVIAICLGVNLIISAAVLWLSFEGLEVQHDLLDLQRQLLHSI